MWSARAYICWLRPILHSRPELRDFYAQTDSFWAALRLRFAGIKTLLMAALGMAASAIVALHDFLVPLATGVDWTPVRDLLPAWAWPIILFATSCLTDKVPSVYSYDGTRQGSDFKPGIGKISSEFNNLYNKSTKPASTDCI